MTLYAFDHWEVNGVTYTPIPLNITVTTDTAITAFYRQTVTPPPSGPILYWKENFENGFANILADGRGGLLQTPPTAEITITSDALFGTHSALAKIVDSTVAYRAQATRWQPMNNLVEAYYGFAFRLMLGFTVNQWTQIAELMEDSEIGQHFGGIFGEFWLNNELRPRISRTVKANNYMIERLWNGDTPMVIGKLYTGVFHLKATIDGRLRFWLDGNLVCDVAGDFRSGTEKIGCSFLAGLYEGTTEPPKSIIFDEMICASTLEEATPTPTPPTRVSMIPLWIVPATLLAAGVVYLAIRKK
jgi:hypothetical protein